MKRLILLLVCCLLPTVAFAEPLTKEALFKLILDQEILRRDSGRPMTLEFMESCLRRDGVSYLVFECEDVNFSHYVSIYGSPDESPVVLITRDGASVENRWAFLMKGDVFMDAKSELWPIITYRTISEALIKATGNSKYTAEYIRRSAHSSYRVKHPESNGGIIEVLSGIPDTTFKTRIGEIRWSEGRFHFHEM